MTPFEQGIARRRDWLYFRLIMAPIIAGLILYLLTGGGG